MYLRTLTLRGFKSFASTTTFEFEPGVTCVVGPNGSGKSNVVDALAWVMGEQGAKSLRGGTMEDVIFAGTSGRAPLGRAEVALTIDNSDGVLPVDYSELTISRTLFRNGGSEYAINGTSCRLLDVQELLSDTGLGRQMHVIVGQGQLDAVLRATPEDRRGFIEEAAGVLKHRRRKDKALRKLDATAVNLARLQDLTGEIQRQLGPLARQAEAARKAATIQADLRDARARLLADDLAQLTARLEQERADETALREQAEQAETNLARAQERVTELEAASTAAHPRLERARETWYRLSSLRERLRGLVSLATERIRLLRNVEPASRGQDPTELEAQAIEMRSTEQELSEEAARARDVLDSAVQARTDAERDSQQASREASARERAAADQRAGLARLEGLVHAQRERYESSCAERARLSDERGQATEQAQQATRDREALVAEAAEAEAGEIDLDAAHEQAKTALAEVSSEVEKAHTRGAAAERDVATWQARVEALELALDRKDGAGALAGSAVQGVSDTFAARLSITEGYEDAVAAALGPFAEAVTVTDETAAVAALAWLRDEDAGRASLVLERSEAGDSAGLDAHGDLPTGAVALADVVTSSAKLAGALRSLVRGIVVVASLEDAQRLRDVRPELTAVTRDGDVLGPTGARGGSASGPSVVHLQSALAAAREELTDAQTQASRGLEVSRLGEERLAAARATLEQTLSRLNESDARMAAVAEELGRLGVRATAAQRRGNELEEAIARIDARSAQEQAELQSLEERLAAADEEPASDSGDLDAVVAERERAAEALSEARARETEARLALRTGEERVRALTGRVDELETAAERERQARRAEEEAARDRAKRTAEAEQVVAGAHRVLAALEGSLERAQTERDQAQQERDALEAELAHSRTGADEARAALAKVQDVAHRDEVARAQQDLKLEQLRERALEELGTEADELMESFGPHQPVPIGEDEDPVPYVRAEQEKRRRAAERAMNLLGRVNPLALEEYAALEERHRFLAEQLEDLKRSRTDLMSIVRDVDERVEKVFTEAFADTAAQFQDVFARLFPGGEGRLVLTDPQDMLTTGVEVEARPAGKKVKRLSLLSGGERSLTAVAILVAIFKARPSPFYVMDEVEAALDDVNLGRLLEIFVELRSESQLIVITHQKRTMEIADALYGVTMRDDGVTAVISQRLRES